MAGMPLFVNIEETVSIILFGVGFTMLMLHRNLIKKIMGMNIMDTAVYLFLAAKGYIKGRMVPIVTDGIQDVSAYINPVPSGLVLTGIVVSVSTTALMLALTIRLYERYGSLDLDQILMRAKEDEEV
ncbi:MAG: cation:proton antiporter subunit C [Lachnospiraceae bacterium]|jgi:multicomponent Na+:H+ antiporter subunit C|nr:cation:proton antiporter subunit C [Lachnospiraceae bacterium]